MSKLPTSNSESSNDANVNLTEERPPGTPRWVMVSGIITIVLVLLFVIMHLFSGGNMGPARHSPSGLEQGVK